MNKKQLVSLGLSICLLAQATIPVCARASVVEKQLPKEEIALDVSGMDLWMQYTSRVTTNLSIDSTGNAIVTASVDGYKDITTKVSIKTVLQKYKSGKWSDVATFSDSASSYKIRIYETIKVSKGYKYRAVTTSTAVHNGKSEIQTVTSGSTMY